MLWLSSVPMPSKADLTGAVSPLVVAVVGAGYVGLTTAAGFASLGHTVRVSEADAARLAELEEGRLPFSEPGLAELVGDAVASGHLTFGTDNAEAVAGADVVFVAVPTPEGIEGAVDLSAVQAALASIAGVVASPTPIVMKSSVPPGSWEMIEAMLADLDCDAPVVVNPEFLQEGRAIQDVLHPYRVVIGSRHRAAADLVAELHRPLKAPVIITDPASAELAKYASNAYLATRLTFVNTIANLAETVNANIDDVIEAIRLDPRIGSHYLRPGPGYGGSCFPKDVRALVAAAARRGHDLLLLRSVVETNDYQLARVVAKVRDAAGGLGGKVVGLLGLAFKDGTADVRGSPALALAELFIDGGALVQAYDPAARVNLAGLTQHDDALAAVSGADVVVVATEWPEFSTIDMEKVAAVMRGAVIVDSRNMLDPETVAAAGLEYRGLGR
jgi:UDPglucose 6-dehydrogenase